MLLRHRSRSQSGLTFVEMLIGLLIACGLFLVAGKMLVSVLRRATHNAVVKDNMNRAEAVSEELSALFRQASQINIYPDRLTYENLSEKERLLPSLETHGKFAVLLFHDTNNQPSVTVEFDDLDKDQPARLRIHRVDTPESTVLTDVVAKDTHGICSFGDCAIQQQVPLRNLRIGTAAAESDVILDFTIAHWQINDGTYYYDFFASGRGIYLQ